MIKYIGSKRRLVNEIKNAVFSLAKTGTIIDLFSGTSRVGHALKAEGYRVFANDHLAFATTLATCYVQADNNLLPEVDWLLPILNGLKPKAGYFTKTFCEESRFFQPFNGEKVDAIREWIHNNELDFELRAVLLTSLMEAADRVDSTVGLQMAYLKEWAPRSYKPLELRAPVLLPKPSAGKCQAFQFDAADAVLRLTGNIAYIDPPYNQHSYLSNYHIWESLIAWDCPETYGIAKKRVDCKTRKSLFNSKRTAFSELTRIVNTIDVKHLVVSFSNEGFITREEMEALLSSRGDLQILEIGNLRYIGSQIGIYNPDGQLTGKPGARKNVEYLYIVRGK